MNKEVRRINIIPYAVLYIFIFMLINSIGAILPAAIDNSTTSDESVAIWQTFLKDNAVLFSVLRFIDFLIPAIICFIYITPKDKNQLNSRFVNMSFRFSGIACIGWLTAFIIELIFALYAKYTFGIKILKIVLDELFYSLFMGFFGFTITYFTLDSLHRNKVLPKFYPDGKVSNYKFNRKASLLLKIRNFYISVSICPVLYLLSCFVATTKSHNISINSRIYIILGIIMFMGFILLLLTTYYVSTPIIKLKQGAKIIESGNYDHHINFISNDDFGELTDTFNDMTKALRNKNIRIAAIQDSIIKGMALMVESRDVNTGGHINRTSDCVKVFAEKLRKHPDYEHIERSFFEKLVKAAPMHDLGKIAVDDYVLKKPGKYTPEEYEMMKIHSAEGAKIVAQVIHEVEDEEFKKIAINVAHYHHEKWDGSGYPCGIKGEDIPFEARIMALADVFDALVSKRCYKDRFDYDKAFKIIEESLGSHFDPFLGLQFLDCRKELEELYDSYLE